ncbi:MAG: HEAT repeat domain-containing protein, partial [Planctomycetota bacterium]
LDLHRLQDEWRLRKGQVKSLLMKGRCRVDVTGGCWRVIEATMRGNPEEWPILLRLLETRPGDRDRVKVALERHRDRGAAEDRRVAAELLAKLGRAEKAPPDRSPEELVAAIRKGPEECLGALREAERRKVEEVAPLAKTVFAKAGSAELRFAAAGALLALGDEDPRKSLLEALRSERAIDAVHAVRVLLRHPGSGEAPIRALFAGIRADEEILRVKPTLLALAIEALGESEEKGAREFLEGLLDSPRHRIDAARALGAIGDYGSNEALRRFLLTPPPRDEEGATEGGLGYLGKAAGLEAAAEAEELRPLLVGAIAFLRLRTPKPESAGK